MKILINKFLFIAVFLFGFQQLGITQNQTLVRKLTTQKVTKNQIKNEPTTRIKKKEREQNLRKFSDQPQNITIPVIFHIFLDEKILSRDQVLSQLDALNRDFSNTAPRDIGNSKAAKLYSGLASDTKIRFCFANKNGKKFEPINYVTSKKIFWSDDGAIKEKRSGGIAPISPEKYLNIWVANLEGTSGYAQMPGGLNKTDGIVIDARFFGTTGTAQFPYDEGKTLTHLVGNYLGLFDLWKEKDCTDDLVDDTPIHNGPNNKCYNNSHISTCSGYSLEMTMNFMDNTPDACMYMFTRGQMYRMQAMLSKHGPRKGLNAQLSECDVANRSALLIAQNEQIKKESSQVNWGQVRLYPNPVSDELTIEMSGSQDYTAFYRIYNAQGKIIYEAKNLEIEGVNRFTIDVSEWTSGVYFVHTQINGEPVSRQFSIVNE